MAKDTIIIADDEAMVRTVMRNMLIATYPKMRCIEVSNGDDAIDRIGAETACVLADVMMPQRDGIAMCRSIRTSAACAPFRDVPVILVSAMHAYDALAQSAWDAGTAFFLRKPFTVNDLVRAVSAATSLLPLQDATPVVLQAPDILRPAGKLLPRKSGL